MHVYKVPAVTVSSIPTAKSGISNHTASGTEENLEKKRELWKYIMEKDIRLFHHLRAGILGNTMNLPGKGGRKISVAAYKLSQKVVGFN